MLPENIYKLEIYTPYTSPPPTHPHPPFHPRILAGSIPMSKYTYPYFSPLNASRRQSPLPYFHPWRRNPPNCFPYAHLDLEMSRKPPPPPASWCACRDLVYVVFFYFVNLLLSLYFSSTLLSASIVTWFDRHDLGMPKYFLFWWRTIQALVSRFAFFLDFWVNPTCKG